ncbi:MAG: HD family phosphohydrolase [Anaerolineales bacterium]
MRPSQNFSKSWIALQILFGLGLIATTAFILVVALPSGYDLEVGDVATRDIRSPRDITFVSEIRSEQARQEATRNVEQIYTSPDAMVARQQLERMRDVLAFLSALRLDPHASDAERYAWLVAVEELTEFPRSDAEVIFNLSESSWNRVQLESLRLLDQIMRQEEIRESRLPEVREWIPVLIPFELAQDEADLVSELVSRFIQPNVFYDVTATEHAQEIAREEVGPAFRTFRSGEIIVREGNVVTALDREAFTELDLTDQQRNQLDIGVAMLFASTLTLVLGGYLVRLQPEVLDGGRLELLMFLLLALFMILARVLLPVGDLLPYLYPGAALAMLLAATVGVTPAIGLTIFLALVGGWIGGHSLGITALIALGGSGAALTLPKYPYTGSIFRSGILAGLVQAAALIVFLSRDLSTEPLSVLIQAGVCVGSGIIAGGLTVGGLFLLAPLFDLTTSFRLMELSRPNHPLLQRLLREVPGTFNHVMMVASLAEQAADRIGANSLLTRVGAYYHDIGKLTRPYFFSENQQGVSNPHDRLDPYTSAEIIVGHVRDGVKLAKQYHLPAEVRAFITEHHGTAKISFFYQKAIEAAGDEESLVDESQFHYPGPLPQRRETLLLMLADSSEAATRARQPSTPEELEEVVDYIFQQRIRDGQLDECPITMRELSMVKDTYIELLRGAFHPRVKYPEPNKTEDTSDEQETSD